MKEKSKAQSKAPTVLIVDDDDEAADATKKSLGSAVVSVCRSPNEVEAEDLEKANLVLVDFKLTHWPERDAQSTPSLKPMNGVALAATLRSNLDEDASRSPTAFALNSGVLGDLSGTLAAEGREHAMARMVDLEWVFSKGAGAEDLPTEVRALALAVKALPHPWPQFQNSEAAIIKLLALDRKAVWAPVALQDIEKACPPQDILAEISKGMAVIRWLLHQVMPFPSFLLDERYLAARLHISPADLRKVLKSSPRSAFCRNLREYEYKGVLHDFTGLRWWRAGIDHWLWRATGGGPLDKNALREVLKKMRLIVPLTDLQQPVVSLDSQFRPTDRFIELSSAVQIKPDDWPLTAEPAWVSLQDADTNVRVAARVVSLDRQKLKD